jgi:hypothetical protein
LFKDIPLPLEVANTSASDAMFAALLAEEKRQSEIEAQQLAVAPAGN